MRTSLSEHRVISWAAYDPVPPPISANAAPSMGHNRWKIAILSRTFGEPGAAGAPKMRPADVRGSIGRFRLDIAFSIGRVTTRVNRH